MMWRRKSVEDMCVCDVEKKSTWDICVMWRRKSVEDVCV